MLDFARTDAVQAVEAMTEFALFRGVLGIEWKVSKYLYLRVGHGALAARDLARIDEAADAITRIAEEMASLERPLHRPAGGPAPARCGGG